MMSSVAYDDGDDGDGDDGGDSDVPSDICGDDDDDVPSLGVMLMATSRHLWG